jgi:hypothetical protein
MLERLGNLMWGCTPRVMGPVVRQFGPARAVLWFCANMPRYLLTLRAFGGLRTHLVGTAISLIYGCPYCSYGEAYAFQLIHLRDRGKLFPLDEDEMGKLCGKPPAAIRHCLVSALRASGLHNEVPIVERTIALAAGADLRPTEPDEIRLAHLVRMLSVLNAAGIAESIDRVPGEALDPVNKDSGLKGEYAALRATAGE